MGSEELEPIFAKRFAAGEWSTGFRADGPAGGSVGWRAASERREQGENAIYPPKAAAGNAAPGPLSRGCSSRGSGMRGLWRVPCSGLAPAPPYDALNADFMQASSPGIPAASLGSPFYLQQRRVRRPDRPQTAPPSEWPARRSGAGAPKGVCGRGRAASGHYRHGTQRSAGCPERMEICTESAARMPSDSRAERGSARADGWRGGASASG